MLHVYTLKRGWVMLTAKVFQSGNSQAIRIPKEVQTDQQEFYIRKMGKGFVLFPTDVRLEDWVSFEEFEI